MSDLQAKIAALLSLGLPDALARQCLVVIAGATRATRAPFTAAEIQAIEAESEERAQKGFAKSQAIRDKIARDDAMRAKGKGKGKAGRLARRSLEAIQAELATVVALLKKKPGLHSEEIRDALKLDKRALPRTLAEGLKTRALKKKGSKRATTYTAV